MENKNKEPDMITMNLDEYYKDPLIESFIYVSMGMDNLKNCDLESYTHIKEKQVALVHETEDIIRDIRHTSDILGLPRLEVDSYIEQFLQKFPLGMSQSVAWDDRNFVFLYIIVRLLKPKVIIETGCNIGFSSTFMALAVKENNNGCMFYTMDLADAFEPWENFSFVKCRKQKINFEKLKNLPPPQALSMVPQDLREHIIFLKGSSKDILPGLLKENKEVDIFFHDSEHSYRNIAWESISAIPYIKKGGYLLVHDVALNSAFKDMFHDAAIVLGDNLGIFKKTDMNKLTIQKLPSLAENSQLNDEEFKDRKIKLDSFPKAVIIQTKTLCNLDCISCPIDKENDISQAESESLLHALNQLLENKMTYCLSQAAIIVLKLCDKFVQLPNWRFIITKLQESFPEADRLFYIHGEYLTPELSDVLTSCWGISFCNSKNIIEVVLPASNSRIYKTLTRSDNFQKVFDQVKYLVHKRPDKDHIKIHFVFPVNTLNIEDFPAFLRLSKDLGVDKVVCYYNYIYIPAQKYLSCFFKQDLTNKILDETEDLAGRMNMKIDLPPAFGLADYPKPGICREPFSQIMFDSQGHVLPCDASKDCNEILSEGKSFMDIWNGPYYQKLRKSLFDGTGSCFKHCLRANPSCVNDFKSHVIHRGNGKNEDINILWGDNF